MLRNEYSYLSDNQIEPKLWVKQFKEAIFKIHTLIPFFKICNRTKQRYSAQAEVKIFLFVFIVEH